VAALVAEVRDERVRVRLGLELAQVDAVHPVELLVVERRRAPAAAVERESLDELVAAHERRLVVEAPSEQREEVDERVRDVAVAPEVVDPEGAVALREL